jgi:hypothetical protein
VQVISGFRQVRSRSIPAAGLAAYAYGGSDYGRAAQHGNGLVWFRLDGSHPDQRTSTRAAAGSHSGPSPGSRRRPTRNSSSTKTRSPSRREGGEEERQESRQEVGQAARQIGGQEVLRQALSEAERQEERQEECQEIGAADRRQAVHKEECQEDGEAACQEGRSAGRRSECEERWTPPVAPRRLRRRSCLDAPRLGGALCFRQFRPNRLGWLGSLLQRHRAVDQRDVREALGEVAQELARVRVDLL